MRLAIVSAGALVAVLSAHPARAADTDVEAVAAEAGVDATDLEGASLTTGLPPAEYLMAVGEMPRPVPINPRVECIIAKESGGLDVPNRQGSGATGPGQYMPSTWRAHTLEMGMPWLSIHSLSDVRRVMTYDLAMGRRRQWTVPGC